MKISAPARFDRCVPYPLAVCVVLAGFTIAGCVDPDGAATPREPLMVEVHAEHYEFRGRTYLTLDELRAAMKRVPAVPVGISAAECIDEGRVRAVVKLLLDRGQVNIVFAEPDDPDADCE